MLFISFLFLALAFAAPLDLSLDLDTVQNLTSVDRCSDSPAWQAYAFLVEDCYSAIQRVYIEEVLKKPNLELYEFVADGSYPKSHHPWMRTPVQFTVSEYPPTTCSPKSLAQSHAVKTVSNPKPRLLRPLHRHSRMVSNPTGNATRTRNPRPRANRHCHLQRHI